MAFTRMSAHEVDRMCKKYEKMFDGIVNQRMKSRKNMLMKRYFFPLSEEDANQRVFFTESVSIIKSVIYDSGFEYQIYESLKEICKVTRAGDFITVDSAEAEFINRMRKYE